MRSDEWILASDIGGTKIAAALVSSEGNIEAFHQETISHEGVESSASQLVRIYRIVAEQASGEVTGWALAVPGIWDARQQKVWAPNIPGWDWIPLPKLLAEKVRVPVFVESDRTAALLGEAWKGEGQGCSDFLFLIVGTGIGLGALSGGKVVSGAHGVGGAVGWFVLPALFGESKEFFMWEEVAAGPAMAARYCNVTGETIDAGTIFERAARGDSNAKDVVRQTAVYLGLGIANLIAAFDPELIVLGGGVSSGFHLLEPDIRRTLDVYGQPISSNKIRLTASRLGPEGPLLGLASIGFQELVTG
jgi:glucokinase